MIGRHHAVVLQAAHIATSALAVFAGGPLAAATGCAAPTSSMVEIPAAATRPGQSADVGAFRIDRTEVTNAQFAKFVRSTGYVTSAERSGRSAIFVSPRSLPRDLNDASQWWAMVAGANWRHPSGPQSDLAGKSGHPVVHVTYDDALAYAHWLGHTLPTVEQWERAARGTQPTSRAAIRWAYSADGQPLANTWQGYFPLEDKAADGFRGLAPVACFAANEFGLYDMIGNAWEWTVNLHSSGHRIVKGGSFLCALNYCANFQPAAWQAQEADLPTSHIGFRTVASPNAQHLLDSE